jgi:hypothetical protein
MTFFQQNGGRMSNVSAFLDKTIVVLLVIDANTIQSW